MVRVRVRVRVWARVRGEAASRCWHARARASLGVTKSVKLTRSHSPGKG